MAINASPLVLLSAGGTGGHVFPARALAEDLIKRGYRVALATDNRGAKYFVGLEDVPRYVLSSGGYVRGISGKISGLYGLVKGYVEAHKLIKQLNPTVVVGFGGYPSAPPIFAAQHRGIPTVLHEQNAILGLANIILAPFAKRIALSFPNTSRIHPLWVSKCTEVGNPVRADISALGKLEYPPIKDKIRLLVVGGSQGAKVFSTAVPYAIVNLPKDLLAKLDIVHQARPEDMERVKSIYTSIGIEAEVRSFFDDMPARLAVAHLLITRSGASTVAELTAAGRPAIYVPFPWNRDLQQVFNAQNVVSVGGGWMILEQDLTVDALQKQLIHLVENPKSLEDAARAALSLGKPEATKKLAEIVAEFH